MAQKRRTVVVCDQHRGDVDAVGSVELAVDGQRRRVDLCAEHMSEFRKAMRPWLGRSTRRAKARQAKPTRATGGRRRSQSRPAASAGDATAIRAWARENGYEVGDRGRIAASVREAFLAAR